jgi:Trypsin-co-occurring domain 1
MQSRYIELGDGIIVEVGSPGGAREEMHSASMDRVDSTMEMVGNITEKIVRTIGESFQNMNSALDVPIEVQKAELAIGLSFSAEGSIFVAKTKAEGSIDVKIVFTTIKAPQVESPEGESDD